MKYYLYARKSSEDKNKQVASIEDQINVMKELAEKMDIEIIKIFSESKSAKKPNNREQFSLMINELYEGKADGIICWKLDRLARNPMDAGIIKQMLQDRTIKHIQVHGNEYKPGDNVLVMDMEFGIANQFVLDLSKNTKRGLNSKAERGQFPSRAPIGYINNTHESKGRKGISPDPEKFDLVRKVWDYMLEGKYSIYEVTRYAQEELALTGYSGKPINKNVLYKMFRNPFYYGNFMWGGKEHQGEHQPMITKSEFIKVQEHLSEKVKVSTKKSYNHPYTKTFTCGECGKYLTAHKKVKTNKTDGTKRTYIYYHCTNKRINDCGQGYLEIKSLEEQINSLLYRLQLPKKITEFCLNRLSEELEKEGHIHEKIIAQHQNEINKIESRIKNLFDMRMSGDINSEDYQKHKADLGQQKKTIEDKITVLKESVPADIYSEVKKGFNLKDEFKEALSEASNVDKHYLVRTIGTDYEILNKEVSIELKPIYEEVRLLVNSIKSEYNLIEPEKALVKQGPLADLDHIGPLMGGY